MSNNRLTLIFIGKGFRVFVFGFLSILIPIYLAQLGTPQFYIFIAIAAIIGGNIFSNVLLTWYGNLIGRRKILLVFSVLMLLSGILLFATTIYPVVLIACFLGNVSTTGTEAGPFQSVETGVLPNLVPEGRKISRYFGYYNLIGYAASSLGALTASLPSYFKDSLSVFHLLFLAYGLVGLLLVVLYQAVGSSLESAAKKKAGLSEISERGKHNIRRLSALNFMDAFGGGFVSQSILSYWFYYVYHVTLADLGVIFLVASVLTGVSTLGASFIAEKLGNLRTMVYTHLLSNVFLIMIPLAGSLALSLAFLFARQCVSQMDVPTRQAFMAEIFDSDDRVSANAITNTFRSGASILGAPISGVFFAAGFVALPILSGGFSKIAYDLAIFFAYRKEAR
ncbi:MAG TPA: MFS transporter [Nitrososphaerales archaeon]|nr:MFS transporter [Nitrososphaerales archaeon]